VAQLAKEIFVSFEALSFSNVEGNNLKLSHFRTSRATERITLHGSKLLTHYMVPILYK